ncbi:MAG: cation-transporting P-type ATPase, partial [Oscillospiraceae bacterium]
MKFYDEEAQEVLSKLNSREGGLTDEDAAERLAKHGFNKLDEGKKITTL